MFPPLSLWTRTIAPLCFAAMDLDEHPRPHATDCSPDADAALFLPVADAAPCFPSADAVL